MSQPSDRGAIIPAPGKVDKSLGEFWVENPWDIVAKGHNLSAFERNRLYLNVPGRAGRDFLEVSFLSGTDSDGDGRSVVAADLRNNGKLDLLVRQVGGGPFFIYENLLPQAHYLKVTLRGTRSNRLGIGARLIATVRGRPVVRELFPHNSFRSQASTIAHFGLGEAEQVDQLEIRWPSGARQVLSNLAADRHVVIEEGKEGSAAIETVTPGQTIRP